MNLFFWRRPKPIFVIGLPTDVTEYDDMMTRMAKYDAHDKAIHILKDNEQKFHGQDYHVLVYTTTLPEPTFQVFHEKDFKKGEFEALQAIVDNAVQQQRIFIEEMREKYLNDGNS